VAPGVGSDVADQTSRRTADERTGIGPLCLTWRVLHVRVATPSDLTDAVVAVFERDTAVSAISVMPGASVRPAGDVVTADIAREGANECLDSLRALGVTERGSVHLEPVSTWLSDAGETAERITPGAGADAVVWDEVAERAYDETELNWTYLAFMALATVLASIAIVLDSQILVIGAMVLGPEFVAIAAIGLALVRREPGLLRAAGTTLLVGFGVAILATALLALVARGLGWVTVEDVTGPRPSTAFIYTPDKWSFIVALIAAAAGVLSLTSSKVGGLSGVFISVTTVPAAGNVALGLAFGAWGEVGGSAQQLALNMSGMVVAGWLTLALQQQVWARRRRLLGVGAGRA
jgi:uncharacterized hydrophobic protein (TIGR00271 family)